MRWIKKGLIFRPNGEGGWMNSHAQVPRALVLEDRIRVFFASRPEMNKSLTGFIDLDIDDPIRILHIHEKPILPLGEEGAFDEHGIMPNHVFCRADKVNLFYVGWSRRQSIPYSNWMGLAVSDDRGTTFKKAYRGPILDRTRDEIFSATGLICLEHEGRWHGWYATGTQWLRLGNRFEHLYEIRYCRSDNLVDWIRPNEQLFAPAMPNESNTSPTVLFRDGRWHMWFCYRGTQDFRNGRDSYRIGYASSLNLMDWVREDEKAGIDVSDDGWDSTMIAYPQVVTVKNKTLMFYNGNGFGRTGFGYAILEF